MFGHFAVKCVQESKVLLRGSSGQRLQQGMLLQLNNSTTVEMLQAVKADETSYLLVEIWRPDHTLRVNTNPCASCWKKTNEGQVLLQTKNMQCEVPSFFRREYRGEQAYATLLRWKKSSSICNLCQFVKNLRKNILLLILDLFELI